MCCRYEGVLEGVKGDSALRCVRGHGVFSCVNCDVFKCVMGDGVC